jgi:hypothetical protein
MVGAAEWSVEAGAASVAVSGVRPYAAKQNFPRNDSPHIAAGFVRLAHSAGARWSLGLAYTYYQKLEGSGASPSSDVFNRGGTAATVVVPLKSFERVHEFSLDARYRWQLSAHVQLEAGPVVSYFRSRAEIGSDLRISAPGGVPVEYYSRLGEFTGNDLRLGAGGAVTWVLSPRWETRVGYRVAAPPNRTLQHISVALNWGF